MSIIKKKIKKDGYRQAATQFKYTKAFKISFLYLIQGDHSELVATYFLHK